MYDYEQYTEPDYYERLRPTVQEMTPADFEYSDTLLTAVGVHKYATEHIEYRRNTGESVQPPHQTQEVGYGDCEGRTVLANSLLKAGGVKSSIDGADYPILGGLAVGSALVARSVTLRPVF